MKTLLMGAAVWAVALAAAGSAPASAQTLLGDVITGSYYFPESNTLYGDFSYSVNPFTVDGTVESVLTVDGDATTNVNFNAHTLILTATAAVSYTAASFNGSEFVVDSGNAFSNVESVVASGGQSVSAFLSGGDLYINWEGQSFTNGDTVTVSFSAVPEPSTWAMMGLGFAGLAFVGYRSRRSAAAIA